ncbi:MAG: transposase domain-containing protein [Sphingobacteriales bacterium]|nr:transposase domain-containing protein [Sphingobacteriales bacterium]
MFATCRLHDVNPEKWLTHLLERIRVAAKDQLHLLLTQNYTTVTS